MSKICANVAHIFGGDNISVVYKQWYESRNKSATPRSNKYHLRYIATRPGTILNKNCGFGLWGKTDINNKFPASIQNLETAMKRVEEASQGHTINRAIVSLDEVTAVQKGYDNRGAWEDLLRGKVRDIAKQNHIELKDMCWLASYHHEEGHPHVHLMFWDDSDAIHNEHMPEEQFEIAMEKIRVSFSRDIFREELAALRNEQDLAKSSLRELMKVTTGDMEASIFYKPPEQPNISFYPKTFTEQEAVPLYEKVERLLYSLPTSGQLQYAYLKPHLKKQLDELTKMVIENTSLKGHYDSYMESIKAVAKTYGNSESAIKRQLEIQADKIIKDLGNDILATIKELDWLSNRDPLRAEALRQLNHDNIEKQLLISQSEINRDENIQARLREVAKQLPYFLTPKVEVMKDEAVTQALYELATEVLQSNKILSQEIQEQNALTKNNEAYQFAYRAIHHELYSQLEHIKGYDIQLQMNQASSFLNSFCGLFKQSSEEISRQRSDSMAWLSKKELGKEAKKEFAKEARDGAGMWR